MPLLPIDDFADCRLDPYRQLKQTNATRRAGLFVCEGEKLLDRLLASRYEVHSVLLSASWIEQIAPRLEEGVPVLVTPDEWIDRLVGFNFHRGVLACGKRGAGATLEEVASGDGPLTLVVCPRVNDPENLGALVRIAHAFGVNAVVLGKSCVDPLSRRVLRVSMGSALRLPLVWTDDIDAALERLHRQFNVELWASVLDADAQPLEHARRPPRLALLLGSEGHGLERRHVERCQRRVTIAMQPQVDSLNVAVAAGISLYCLTRDR